MLIVCAAALGMSACGSGLAGNVGNGSGGSTAAIPQVNHVAVVVLENANYGDIVGTSNMPYLQSLMKTGSLVNHYYANSHPSIPNYFMMTTGQAITNLDSYTDTVNTDNVVRELVAANKSWKVYAESLPSVGYTGGDQGLYIEHHNPISYFSDVRQNATQAANIVPFAQLAQDLNANALPNYSFIVPNMVDDAHSCGGGVSDCTLSSRLAVADTFLQNYIAPLLSNASFQQSGLLIIVFDESADDITNGGGHIVAVVAGTHVKANYTASTTSYDHRSLLSLTMKALGVPNIPNGADAAPQMTEYFQ